MKASLLIIVALLAAPARVPNAPRAQGGVEHFSKDGLSFDYPAGWAVDDKSSAELQHLVLRRPESTVLLMVVALRAPLQSLDQLHASRRSITRPYVESLARQLGAKIPEESESQCLTVGESLAPGYRLAGRIAQEPAT
ncbi:MAG TPA: hypothetical protein VF508_14165, partial [Pyrinomonadaceae bacterium]